MIDERPLAAPDAIVLWPGRLRDLVRLSRAAPDDDARAARRAELWRLLNLALQRYARIHARRFGFVDAEAVVDIAADKALEIMTRWESRGWDPEASGDAQIRAFLAAVARNGVVDALRRRRREVSFDAAAIGAGEDEETAAPDVDPGAPFESIVDGPRYARALAACAGRLTARARRAWVMRVFGGLPVAQIARHPEVRTSLGGAHVMLNRVRRAIRRCLCEKGLETQRMPAGTFVALWEMIDARSAAVVVPAAAPAAATPGAGCGARPGRGAAPPARGAGLRPVARNEA